jgi:hypothetical protein
MRRRADVNAITFRISYVCARWRGGREGGKLFLAAHS